MIQETEIMLSTCKWDRSNWNTHNSSVESIFWKPFCLLTTLLVWKSRNSHNSCLSVGISYNHYHRLPTDYSEPFSLSYSIRNYEYTVCPCKKYNTDHSNFRSWFLMCFSCASQLDTKKISLYSLGSFFLPVVTWWFLKCLYFSAWLVFVRNAWTKLDNFAFTATLWASYFKNKTTELWPRDFKMVWHTHYLAHTY